ncbi:MAG TPA: ABC transporter substrate-binding protein [Acidimicrobiales bacterium]|nr:ABC transporter substrate-binding protein [Acidimicrobiales bacterium]
MIYRRKLASITAVAALAVGLAACSSSAKSGSSSTTTSGSSTTGAASSSTVGAPSGPAIKVGLICTCSGGGGLAAVVAPGADMYKAWAQTVNASGGLAGHPVQVVAEDDAGNPGTSSSEAQALIAQHVVAIADLSIVDQTWAPTVQAAKIPVVGVLTYESPFGTNPDFYPEAQTNDSAIYAVVKTAKAAGATSMANVYCAEAPICAQSVPAFKAIGGQLGLPVSYNAEVAATAPNYTAQCLAAQQQGIKSVFIGEAQPIIIRIAGDCTTQGYKPVYVTEGAGFGLKMASAPGLRDGLWTEFPAYPFFDTSSRAVQAADAAMDKYYPGERQNQSVFLQQDFMAWTSGQLLADAVKAGGLSAAATPSAAEVVSGLDSLKGDTVGGLTAPLTFTAGQPHTDDCWFTARVQNGTPTLLDQGRVSCEKSSS